MPSQRFNIIPRLWAELSALALVAIVLAGCTVTFISSYDEATDKGITALQKSVDSLMTQLDQNPLPEYNTMKKSYAAIRTDLSSLLLRNEARPKNTLTVKQLDELKAVLDTLEGQHKANTLNQPMLGPSRDILNQTFLALLKLELEKKELNKKE